MFTGVLSEMTISFRRFFHDSIELSNSSKHVLSFFILNLKIEKL